MKGTLYSRFLAAVTSFALLALTMPSTRPVSLAAPSATTPGPSESTLSESGLVAHVPGPRPRTALSAEHYAGYVVLKFREGSAVRLRGNRAVSLAGADLAAFDAVLAGYPGLAPERLFRRAEALLDQERLRDQQHSGWQLADLNLYYLLPVAGIDKATALADALNALDVVEVAYPEPRAEPAAFLTSPRRGDVGVVTPSFVSQQVYLQPAGAANGLDAVYAWTRPGGNGAGVRFIDLEYAWRTTHEDLGSPFYQGGQTYDGQSYVDHGTAVLGEVVGENDGSGVTGIAWGAGYGLRGVYDDWNSGAWPSVANGINAAAANLSARDIILLELHNPTDSTPPGEQHDPNCGCGFLCATQYGYIAMEYWQANYDAIRAATAAGIVVVEAAGNGEMNLDNPFYGGAFDRSRRDSGAILVGAGNSGQSTAYSPARAPACYSNYGSAVDVQGWGDSIWTLAYGDGWDAGQAGGSADDQDQWYTDSFAGTSGASPMVVGAAASINGMRKAAGLPVLTPVQMRTLLRQTGVAQARDRRQIGPLPNLRAAAGGLFHAVAFSDIAGNMSGAPDPGEQGLRLDVSLQTLGVDTYHNVSAVLSSGLPQVSVATGANSYPTLAPGGAAVSRSFVFNVDPSLPCGAVLPFTLSVTSDKGTYTASVNLQSGVLGASRLTFDSTDTPRDIVLSGVDSQLTAGENVLIGDLDVTVWISHTSVSQLQATLSSPGGAQVVDLWLEGAAGGGDDFAGTVFDDEAVAAVGSATEPRAGHYRPAGWLADFDAVSSAGVWTLRVTDPYPLHQGDLNRWRLTITPRLCFGELDERVYLPAVLRPGP